MENSESLKKEDGVKKWYAVTDSLTPQTGKQMTKPDEALRRASCNSSLA